MEFKTSFLSGIIKCKCPKCNQGDLFTNANPYNLKEILSMHKQCNNCGMYYEKEPGFWTGAMYVSYVIIVTILLISLILLHIILNFPIEIVVPISIGTVVLGYPLLLRYSRVIYLYLMS